MGGTDFKKHKKKATGAVECSQTDLAQQDPADTEDTCNYWKKPPPDASANDASFMGGWGEKKFFDEEKSTG